MFATLTTCFLRVATVLWSTSLLSGCSSAYDLQDTIHSLKEENLHLQHQLENLTQAVRDLKRLVTEHSKVSEGERAEHLRTWREWSQHGISAETHRMLEQAFCVTELHNAAHAVLVTQTSPSRLVPAILTLLTRCLL